MTTEDTAWFVVHTKFQQDRICADALERKKFGVYLPMRQTVVTHARRKQVVMRPAFGRYLFVELKRAAPPFAEVKRTIGVEWLVQSATSPLPIPADLVAALRQAEDAGTFDDPACNRTLEGMAPALPRRGDKVKIMEGPFAGFLAEVARADSERRIEVVIRQAEGFMRLNARLTTSLAKLDKVA